MKDVQLISLSAPRPQSGKDTLANMLVKHFGEDQVVTIAFGDRLREAVAHLFGHAKVIQMMASLHDERKDRQSNAWAGYKLVHADFREWMIQNGHSLTEPRSPRWYMQHFGNDYMKDHMGFNDYWLDVVNQRIAQLKRNKPDLELIIVTDTRSPNEFNWLKSQGAKFFMVKRIGFPIDHHDDTTNRHAVETHAESWDYDETLWNVYGDRVNFFYSALSAINK